MAGQPKRRAMLAELERRTREEFDGDATHLDFAEHWLSNGKSLQDLADAVGAARETLRRYLLELDAKAGERLDRARARGAHSLVDKATTAFDGIVAFKPSDDITLAKSKSDMQLRVAALWNRDEFGAKPPASVNITFNTLHLDALRIRPATVTVEQQPAIAGAIDADYETISDDNATS